MVEYTWIVDKLFEAVRAIIDKQKRRYYWSPLEPLRRNGSVKTYTNFLPHGKLMKNRSAYAEKFAEKKALFKA